ncbi:MAG TPA: HAD family hydrolase [Candidatus Kaiserbacteria bacterium]|nr:HAD family hydrolase [Candidatus Kaiserbacteria bacterium]
MSKKEWYSKSVSDVISHFSTDLQKGLSEEEAGRRLAKGVNKIPEPKQETMFMHVVDQLKSPIALVLVFATIGALFVGTFSDATVIIVALLVNVVLGVFQEHRVESSFSSLRSKENIRASVVRSGVSREIDSGDIVPGDIVLLSAGTAVPADIRIVETHSLMTNESTLTGEWGSIDKKSEQISKEAVLAERVDMVYAGTFITGGAGRGVVVATGVNTEIGAVSNELSISKKTKTPLERDMLHAARFILMIAVFAIVLVFVLALTHGVPFAEASLVAIAIAVASVPEGLPAAVTVVLALGMERILDAGGLVKSLLSAETLGATSVILTDKTGTLTEGRMRVDSFVTRRGIFTDVEDSESKRVLRSAILASSDGYIERVKGEEGHKEELIARGRPIEQALVFAGLSAGLSESVIRSEHPTIDLLPFDANRRFGGMLVLEKDVKVAYFSGAPEVFLSGSRKSSAETEHSTGIFTQALNEATSASKRVIAVARVPWHKDYFPTDDDLLKLVGRAKVIGLVTFADTIRKEAGVAVAQMQEAGARVVMATGDNKETAIVVARAVGIANANDIARTGAELAGLSDDSLYELVMKETVFARVTPADKLRIVRVLQNNGEVVAMTGDGVNDAPALKAASIGIAIGSGTDVAKDAADMVLLEDSFAVITDAIREGRRLRDNIKKVFTYLVATTFGGTFVIVTAFAFGFPLPILPTQILWTNLINGGPMNIAFAFEPLYPSAMKRSPRDSENARVLSPSVIKLILAVGLSTGLLLVGLFLFISKLGLPETEIRTMIFVGLSFDAIFTAVSLKSFGTPITQISFFSNRFLIVALLGSVFMIAVALFVPPVQFLLNTVPLSLRDIGILGLLGFADLFMVEFAKYIIYIRPMARARGAIRV